MNAPEEKKIIRARMKSLRAALDPDTFRALGGEIGRRALSLPELSGARTVHIYVSAVNNEVDTLDIITVLFERGKRVIVPRCAPEQYRLQHIRINSLEELRPSRFGLLEPDHNPESEVDPLHFDLIIAPLMAFDRRGGRLGFGGGYYDFLFHHCPCPKVGLAYSFQEVPSIPLESHDRALDVVVTEKEIIRLR